MAIDFSGPSREEWDAFFAWADTPRGRAMRRGLREGVRDFRDLDALVARYQALDAAAAQQKKDEE